MHYWDTSMNYWGRDQDRLRYPRNVATLEEKLTSSEVDEIDAICEIIRDLSKHIGTLNTLKIHDMADTLDDVASDIRTSYVLSRFPNDDRKADQATDYILFHGKE